MKLDQNFVVWPSPALCMVHGNRSRENMSLLAECWPHSTVIVYQLPPRLLSENLLNRITGSMFVTPASMGEPGGKDVM